MFNLYWYVCPCRQQPIARSATERKQDRKTPVVEAIRYTPVEKTAVTAECQVRCADDRHDCSLEGCPLP